MGNQAGFILKVLVISAALSILIKYVGPFLNIGATSVNVLIAVFLPTIVMGAVLGWRAWQDSQPD